MTAAWPRSSRTTRSLQLEDRLGGLRRGLVHDEVHLAADHHVRQLLAGRLGWRRRADHPAAAEDGDAVRDFEDLVQLVRDEDDRRAALDQGAHDRHELLGLLWREDCRGLVEDEDVGLAIERLEDLDALADADRQILDHRVRIHLEAVPLRDLDDPGLRLLAVEHADGALRVFDAEHDVLGDREDRHEHEVLMDHADAGRDRVARPVELDRLVVDQDLALVRLVEAVQDVHEGRLARAVFAEQAENLAGLHDEVDPLVRHDPGEALGDPP